MSTLKVCLVALAVAFARADTVTTVDSRTWNGSVTAINGGTVTLNATFPTGPQTLTFGADYIRAIEFNKATYNPGSNPINVLPKPNPVVKTLSGIIYRQKMAALPCVDITAVSANSLSCRLKPPENAARGKTAKPAADPTGIQGVARVDVIRIVIGPQ
jgi:hypothetical protein